MAVLFATYGDGGRFVDDHNVLVDMDEGDWLAGHGDFVPVTIHLSGSRVEGGCEENPETISLLRLFQATVP